MNAIQSIRREIFRVNQTAFAAIAGVDQTTVSRWERGRGDPTREQLSRIRDAARARGIDWQDEWFFESAPVVHHNRDTGDENQPRRAAQ